MIYAVPSVQFEGRSGYLPGGTYSQLAYPYKAQMSWSFITELLLHTSSLCTTEQHLYLSIYYYCLLHSYLVNVELLLFTVLTLFFFFFFFLHQSNFYTLVNMFCLCDLHDLDD